MTLIFFKQIIMKLTYLLIVLKCVDQFFTLIHKKTVSYSYCVKYCHPRQLYTEDYTVHITTKSWDREKHFSTTRPYNK